MSFVVDDASKLPVAQTFVASLFLFLALFIYLSKLVYFFHELKLYNFCNVNGKHEISTQLLRV